jgi:hypothetical protein
MPCEKYKSPGQRNLCFQTKGWKDWSSVKKNSLTKLKTKTK